VATGDALTEPFLSAAAFSVIVLSAFGRFLVRALDVCVRYCNVVTVSFILLSAVLPVYFNLGVTDRRIHHSSVADAQTIILAMYI